ncbi:ROK family protein [Cedecea sp.]|jgi:predicted NBD/HSP70 family sugar kinase|uniref:ROK family protein n=1 Tax=Cedecea sp. TaxID=1970739 RepID=UPI0039C871C4
MRLFFRFDIGGIHVKHGLFTEEGEVLIAEEYDTHYDRQLFLDSWQSVVSLFDPQAILPGDGVSTQPMLYPMRERHLAGFKFWDVLKVPIRPCMLGNKAGMLGAVWLAKQKD